MVERVRIGSLDFDTIKQSLVDYLNTQGTFTDHNFEGSGLSSLLNLMAYNAHYDSLAANFLANEMFLDTAVKRSSVVSHAKALGYTARSRRAARAELQLTFYSVANAAALESIVIPAGAKFSANINDNYYTFTTMSAKSITRSTENGEFIYRGTVTVYEGMLTQQTVKYNDIDKTVNIPNVDMDTSTLMVQVRPTLVDEWVEYQLPISFLTLTPTTNAYFINEGFNGYDVEFGDGIFGTTIKNGSDVRFTYVVTSGAAGNGAAVFNSISTIAGTNGAILKIMSVNGANGGLDKESIESIRSNATLQYGTQNRAVIANDYAALALQNFAFISDCQSWDGSDNVPPKFGKVVICAQPTVGDVLSTAQKATVAAFLQGKGVANTKVDFVDPEYIDLIVSSTVKYNVNQLTIGTYELEYIVKSAIAEYAATNIHKFGSKMRYSSLVKAIDAANYAIEGNLTSVSLLKKYTPNIYAVNNIRFEYANAIQPGTFKSSKFTIPETSQPVYLVDTAGKINIVYDLNGRRVVFRNNTGSINYRTGTVQIDNLDISRIDGLFISFTATPTVQDLVSSKNVILNLASENIDVKTISDTQ